jgi:hypothetical protein
LRIPFDSLSIDTASSSPQFYDAVLVGLKDIKEAERLIWAMKREKGEQIHLDNRNANYEAANLLREMLARQG